MQYKLSARKAEDKTVCLKKRKNLSAPGELGGG